MNYSFEDIALYTQGDMNAETLAAFEAELANNIELQQQLAMFKDVENTLQSNFQPDENEVPLRATLNNARQQYFINDKPATKVVSFKNYIRTAVAAAAVIIALMVWRPWQPNLYNRFADTHMLSEVERGENADTILQNATTAFNKKDFTTSKALLQKVLAQQPANNFARFYYAISLLQTDETNNARLELNNLYNGESIFKYDAAFYLALSYIKDPATKDKAASRDYLKRIPADAPVYEKAQLLLKEL